MDKFRLPDKGQERDTMNRTVRFSGANYDRLMACVEKHGVSFNRLVNECVAFALARLDESETEGK